ncbi:hypothetical protein JCM8547_002348 [Rhodosporidiobolus lusitaniae]
MPHAVEEPEFSVKWYERDYVGYGRNPPNPRWPNQANIAVNFVLNFEEGGERSVEFGFDQPEDNLHEFKGLTVAKGARDPSVETQFDYGARVAIWRILDLFEDKNIPITFYAVGRAFENSPHIAKAAEEGGHEVASHCHSWQPHANMTAEEEEAWIRRAVDAFKATSPSGKVPVGWYYGRPSERTVELIQKVYKENGDEFLYFSDTYADDLPYWAPRPGEPGKGLLLLPYTLDNNDFKIWHGQFGSDDALAQRFIDSFITIRDEAIANKRYGYITCALHTRWIGRPGRFQALKRVVEYFAKHDDVWFATREQIARHFQTVFTYEDSLKLKAENKAKGFTPLATAKKGI